MMSPTTTARERLHALVSQPDPAEVHNAAEALVPFVNRLGLDELALAIHRCDAAGVRDERLLVDAAWAILHHRPMLPGGAASDEEAVLAAVNERGYLQQAAAVVASMLRITTRQGLTNDYHLAASAFGRATELVPHMHGQSLGEVMEAVAAFNRLHFSYDEALAQTQSGVSGEGALVGANGVRDEAFAPELDDGYDAAAADRVVSEGEYLQALEEAAAATLEGGEVEDDAGQRGSPPTAFVRAQELAARRDDASEAFHPNMVDALVDACEARVLELCDKANKFNAELDGLEMPEVSTDRAAGDTQQTATTLEEVLVAKEPASLRGQLPRAVVLSTVAIRSLLGAWAAVGYRDERVIKALAAQIRAAAQQHQVLSNLAQSRARATSSSSSSELARRPVDAMAPRLEGNEWWVGPFPVSELLEILAGASRLVPRITDVLDPEAAGRTSLESRVEAITPLLASVAPMLLRLPFDYVARAQPDTIIKMRQMCERLPVVADACPALWDKLRNARINRKNLSGSLHGPGTKNTSQSMLKKSRLLGNLASEQISNEERRRNITVQHDVPMPYRKSNVPEWAMENRKEIMRKVTKRGRRSSAVGFIDKRAVLNKNAPLTPRTETSNGKARKLRMKKKHKGS